VETGRLPSSQPVQIELTLAPTQDRAAALDQFLSAVIDPRSPSYHQWLTPQQYATQYGATADQVAAVTAWAQGQGLTVGALSAGGNRLRLSGSAAQIELAFGVGLKTYQMGSGVYFGTTDQPSLPAAVASSVAAIHGLNDLPTGMNGVSTAIVAVAGQDAFVAAASAIDANSSAVLSLDSTACASDFAATEAEQYRQLFRQASAQGITVLATSGCATGASFPALLADVTAVSLTGAGNDVAPANLTIARPTWQAAPGLPANALRVEPDLTTPSLSALAQTIAQIIQEAGGRQGNIGENLYRLATIPGLYTQPDSAPAGTWEPATGLGTVDLTQLVKVYPHGTGTSYTSFSASSYAPTHGQSITLTSTVTSGTGGATPTGTVTFTITAKVLGTATLNAAGVATFTTNSLEAGSDLVGADYSGDSTYAPSNSTVATISVQPEPSNLSATVSSNNIVGGTFLVSVTDTVTLGMPTGTINVSVFNSNYSGTLAGSSGTTSIAQITIPASTVGTATMSISCTATSNYTCNSPYTLTVTIGKATPVLSYNYTPTTLTSGGQVALSATVAGYGTAPTPTGNVVFYDNTTVLNASTLTNGSTTTTGTLPSATTHAISANYNGDANYVSATATTPGAAATTSTTTTSVGASSSSVTSGVPITLTAIVTPATIISSALPTGTVDFYDGTTLLGAGTLSAGGSGTSSNASYSTSSLSSTVSHSISAVYLGDTHYAGSTSSAIPLSANSGLTTVTAAPTASATSLTYGTAFTLSTSVTPSTGTGTPTGTVQFLAGGLTLLCSATLSSGSGSCTPSATLLTAGSYSIAAVYSGDSTYAASTSKTTALTVTASTATLAATISPTTSVVAGATLTVTATVTLGTGVTTPPSGAVTVTITGVTGAVYSGTLSGTAGTNTATATISVTAPIAGTYTAVVACPASASYTCTPVSLAITTTAGSATTTTTLTISPTAPVTGQAVTLTATVATAQTTPTPTGSVAFYDNSKLIQTVVLGSTGVVSIVTTLPAGSNALYAVYSGDTNYTTSTSATLTVVPTSATPASTAVYSNVTSALAGFNIVLTAKIYGGTTANLVPSGTVSFYDTFQNNSILLGTATLAAVGVGQSSATITTTGLFAGVHSITIVYSGDTNFLTSTSLPLLVSIYDYGVTLVPSTMFVTQGQSAPAVLVVTSLNGFAGTVTFGCTPPANSLITCSYSPAVLTGGQGSTTVTIGTAKQSNAIPVSHPVAWLTSPFAGATASLALLLCVLFPGRRRRRLLPSLLLVLIALEMSANLGCIQSTTSGSGTTATGGTPFGTSVVVIDTVGSDGISTVHHDYQYQVTVQ
jgi:hypothetical protein